MANGKPLNGRQKRELRNAGANVSDALGVLSGLQNDLMVNEPPEVVEGVMLATNNFLMRAMELGGVIRAVSGDHCDLAEVEEWLNLSGGITFKLTDLSEGS